jgi:hypothetical protein
MSNTGHQSRQKRIADLKSEAQTMKAIVVAGIRGWSVGAPVLAEVNAAFRRVLEIGSLLHVLTLTLQPAERFSHGQVYRYVIALPNDVTAILDLVAAKGWRLTIREHGAMLNRGVFGTTHDIVELLTAEYFPPHPI